MAVFDDLVALYTFDEEASTTLNSEVRASSLYTTYPNIDPDESNLCFKVAHNAEYYTSPVDDAYIPKCNGYHINDTENPYGRYAIDINACSAPIYNKDPNILETMPKPRYYAVTPNDSISFEDKRYPLFAPFAGLGCNRASKFIQKTSLDWNYQAMGNLRPFIGVFYKDNSYSGAAWLKLDYNRAHVTISPWQNPENRFDVSGNGYATSVDATYISNILSENTERVDGGEITLSYAIDYPISGSTLTNTTTTSGVKYPDVNGDGKISALDSQQINTYLSGSINDTVPTGVSFSLPGTLKASLGFHEYFLYREYYHSKENVLCGWFNDTLAAYTSPTYGSVDYDGGFSEYAWKTGFYGSSTGNLDNELGFFFKINTTGVGGTFQTHEYVDTRFCIPKKNPSTTSVNDVTYRTTGQYNPTGYGPPCNWVYPYESLTEDDWLFCAWQYNEFDKQGYVTVSSKSEGILRPWISSSNPRVIEAEGGIPIDVNSEIDYKSADVYGSTHRGFAGAFKVGVGAIHGDDWNYNRLDSSSPPVRYYDNSIHQVYYKYPTDAFLTYKNDVQYNTAVSDNTVPSHMRIAELWIWNKAVSYYDINEIYERGMDDVVRDNKNFSLYLQGNPGQTAPLHIKGAIPIDDSGVLKLSIDGSEGSGYAGKTNLYIQDKSSRLDIPLHTKGAVPITEINNADLYLSNNGFTNTTTLHIRGAKATDSFGVPNLFIHGSDTDSGNMTLYTAGGIHSDNIPLFVKVNRNAPNQTAKLYTTGFTPINPGAEQAVKELNLYINGESGQQTENITLYMPVSSRGTDSGTRTLYIKADDGTKKKYLKLFLQNDSDTLTAPLYMDGTNQRADGTFVDGYGNGITLFINRPNESTWMPMFIKTSEGAPNSYTELYTFGAYIESSSVPLAMPNCYADETGVLKLHTYGF